MGYEATSIAGANSEDSTLSLTVIILTKNEASHLCRAIESIRSVARRIVVVDSGSSDDTVELARPYGADVYHRHWINYSEQFQWALDNTSIETDWVLRLDADEWIGTDLVNRLVSFLPKSSHDVTGISFDRRHYFLGRWIRHGGRYPLRLLRIFRNGIGRIEQRWMDEHIVLDHGRIVHLEGVFVDQNDGGLNHFIAKHALYATREAVDVLIAKYDLSDIALSTLTLRSTEQAVRTRSRKLSWYNHMPFALGPMLYFIYRYFIRLGFLDGKAGLIYHVLQGFWYRFLVDAKRFEFERKLTRCTTKAERIACLESITGLEITSFLTAQTEVPARDE